MPPKTDKFDKEKSDLVILRNQNYFKQVSNRDEKNTKLLLSDSIFKKVDNFSKQNLEVLVAGEYYLVVDIFEKNKTNNSTAAKPLFTQVFLFTIDSRIITELGNMTENLQLFTDMIPYISGCPTATSEIELNGVNNETKAEIVNIPVE